MTQAIDRELVAKALEGDKTAFSHLVQRYRREIYRLVHSYLPTSADAEDLVQDIFSEAYLKLENLKDYEQFRYWLRGIARHLCLSHLRRRPSRNVSYEEISQNGYTEINISDTFVHEFWQATPEEHFAQEEEHRYLRNALDRLPEKSRAAIDQHYLEERSYQEMAQILNVPISTIEGRLYRARKHLKEEILKMAKADIDEVALQSVIEEATKDLKDEITGLKNQLKVISLEDDNFVDEAKKAAYRTITRLPVHMKTPLTWGIVGSYRIDHHTRSSRIAMRSTDIDEYLSRMSNEEIAQFASLFTNPHTLAILKRLVNGSRKTTELAKDCALSTEAFDEALGQLEKAQLILQEDGKIKPKGDAITYLLTFISMSMLYLNRTGSGREK